MDEREAVLGLIAALLHDTGYIQTAEDECVWPIIFPVSPLLRIA